MASKKEAVDCLEMFISICQAKSGRLMKWISTSEYLTQGLGTTEDGWVSVHHTAIPRHLMKK